MKITEVTVSFGRTQNTGNFNSLRVDATYRATLDPMDTPEGTVTILGEMAKAEVQRQIWDAKESYADDWPASPR